MPEKQRKSIAPQEWGELPNEQRCKQCMRLLSEYEDLQGNLSKYCQPCGIAYSVTKVEDRQ